MGTSKLTEHLVEVGASIEAVCALIAGLVGWFTLAPPGTPLQDLTPRNKQGGQVKMIISDWHEETLKENICDRF